MQLRVNNIPPVITKNLLYIGLTFLLVSPAFALGSGARNMLLIVAMAVSPIVLLLYPVFTKKVDIALLAFLLLTIAFPLLNHPLSMRWSTVLYTGMFGLYIMALYRLYLFSEITPSDFSKFLKVLIYAYFVVLLIQQFCVLTGLPIFNVSNYNILEPWKLNSLMSEPEHSGRMIALLMYSYLTMQEIVANKSYTFEESLQKEKYIWIAFLYSMITMVSAGAYVFLLVVLSKYLSKRMLIYLVIIVCLMVTVVNSETFMRAYKLAIATLTFDIHEIYRADQSGALRFVPAILCLQHIDIWTWDAWFGEGVDYVSTILSDNLPGVNKGYVGGGLFQYAVDYGLIPFFIFTIFSFKACYDSKNKIASVAFWIFSILLCGINVQLLWSTLMILMIDKEIRKVSAT